MTEGERPSSALGQPGGYSSRGPLGSSGLSAAQDICTAVVTMPLRIVPRCSGRPADLFQQAALSWLLPCRALILLPAPFAYPLHENPLASMQLSMHTYVGRHTLLMRRVRPYAGGLRRIVWMSVDWTRYRGYQSENTLLCTWLCSSNGLGGAFSDFERPFGPCHVVTMWVDSGLRLVCAPRCALGPTTPCPTVASQVEMHAARTRWHGRPT